MLLLLITAVRKSLLGRQEISFAACACAPDSCMYSASSIHYLNTKFGVGSSFKIWCSFVSLYRLHIIRSYKARKSECFSYHSSWLTDRSTDLPYQVFGNGSVSIHIQAHRPPTKRTQVRKPNNCLLMSLLFPLPTAPLFVPIPFSAQLLEVVWALQILVVFPTL